MRRDKSKRGAKGNQKTLRQSGEAQEQQKEDIVIGRRAVYELMLHAPERIQSLLLLPNLKRGPEFTTAVESLIARKTQVQELQREDFELRLSTLLSPDDNHQGTVAFVKPRRSLSLEEVLERAESKSGGLVILDEVSDPQNLGAILRAAECAGMGAVVSSSDRSASLSLASKRASAGASELIPFVQVTNLARAIREVRDAGFWIVGTALDTGSRAIYECELPRPTAFVFGSEGKGMRKLTKELCDLLVYIPMQGRIESLNVSQAVSVVLFEAARRSQLQTGS